MRARWVLLGGLTVGTVDILDAFVYAWLRAGVTPERVLKGIAAGWMGRQAALAGGWGTALLGLASHFLIATTVVLLYQLAAARVPALRRRSFVWGTAYGLVVFGVMTYVVIPLSAIATVPRLVPVQLANLLFAHVCLIGIPAALFARRALRGEQAAPAAAAGSGDRTVLA